MNIQHLKYAVEVAKTGFISKAAETLYINQPNLSRAIRELEGSLGITLFERSAKGMTSTREGREFLRNAEKVLAELDEIENYYKKGAAARQRFSLAAPRASYIGEAFVRFSRAIGRAPAEVFYQETGATDAIQRLLSADYQLGVIRYAARYDRYFRELLDEKGLAHELIAAFGYRLAMSEKHPLAKKSDIRFADLAPFMEIVHANSPIPAPPLAAAQKEERPDNVSRRIFVFDRASQFRLLCENTETFMWVSPVPASILSRHALVQKDCSENQKQYKDMLIYRKEHRLSELDRAFITELCAVKRECFQPGGRL